MITSTRGAATQEARSNSSCSTDQSGKQKRAPPMDRGELHIGGVAVVTRPFSGLLPKKNPSGPRKFPPSPQFFEIRQNSRKPAIIVASPFSSLIHVIDP